MLSPVQYHCFPLFILCLTYLQCLVVVKFRRHTFRLRVSQVRLCCGQKSFYFFVWWIYFCALRIPAVILFELKQTIQIWNDVCFYQSWFFSFFYFSCRWRKRRTLLFSFCRYMKNLLCLPLNIWRCCCTRTCMTTIAEEADRKFPFDPSSSVSVSFV